MALNFNVNLLAVLVAGIVAMIIGSLWYGPLFGKAWMRLSKMTPKDMDAAKKKGMGKYYFAAFIIALITMYFLAVFLKSFGATTILDSIVISFFVWLGFMATYSLSDVIWGRKPFALYLMRVVETLITFEAAGIILTLWV